MSDRMDGDCRPGTSGQIDLIQNLQVDKTTLMTVKQVHGCSIVEVYSPAVRRKPVDGRPADGIITRDSGVALGIAVADCVPVMLYDPTTGVTGLLHAGREGTRNGIVAQTVEHLTQQEYCCASCLYAVVGPSAGPCCYEVSEELASSLECEGLPVSNRKVDLWSANVAQLERSGVPAANISVAGICTICDGRFFSYRRNDKNSRNLCVLAT